MGVIEAVNEYVRNHYDLDEYNWIHNEFVTEMALKLGSILNADLEILEIAARLHDIDYSRGKEYHVADSAEKAKEILSGEGYPEDRILKVQQTILSHSGKTLKKIENPSVEGRILYDADKMWVMTPKGFARLIAHRYKNNTSYKFILEKMSKAIEKYNKLHFDESRDLITEKRNVCIEFLESLK